MTNKQQALQDLELLLNSPIPVRSIRKKLLEKAIKILTNLSEIEDQNSKFGKPCNPK